MFDTHCHLNFEAFAGQVDEVVERAKDVGVDMIVIPGTDVETSKKAVEIAQKFENVYAAVGIHPHHVFQTQSSKLKAQNYSLELKTEIQDIEKLITNPKVVALGEVGVDRHYYKNTKYPDYQIDEAFIELQKELLKAQIDLALKYEKSLILHNREAKKDILTVLHGQWDARLEGRTVFHCCEPDFVGTGHVPSLLEFAKEHAIYIGVDGDVTYRKDKQEFIKKAPLSMLVLETDSPFLHPEPLRSQPRDIRAPNEPKNLKLIAEFITRLRNKENRLFPSEVEGLIDTTSDNARKLFRL